MPADPHGLASPIRRALVTLHVALQGRGGDVAGLCGLECRREYTRSLEVAQR